MGNINLGLVAVIGFLLIVIWILAVSRHRAIWRADYNKRLANEWEEKSDDRGVSISRLTRQRDVWRARAIAIHENQMDNWKADS